MPMPRLSIICPPSLHFMSSFSQFFITDRGVTMSTRFAFPDVRAPNTKTRAWIVFPNPISSFHAAREGMSHGSTAGGGMSAYSENASGLLDEEGPHELNASLGNVCQANMMRR